MTETEIDLDSISVSVIRIQFQCDFFYSTNIALIAIFVLGMLGVFYGGWEKGSPGDMRGFRLSADKPTMSPRPFSTQGIKSLPSDLVHAFASSLPLPPLPADLIREWK